jgi:hypothetical protein
LQELAGGVREGHPCLRPRASPRELVEAAFFSFIVRSPSVRARFSGLHERSRRSCPRLVGNEAKLHPKPFWERYQTPP